MASQLDILLAAKALVQGALPLAEVIGFDGDTSEPAVIGAEGTVIGIPGDPGEPEIDLSPLTYHYRWPIGLQIGAAGGAGGATLQAMLTAIGAAIAADRTLGGLAGFVEAVAAIRDDRTIDEATIMWADAAITVEFATPDPLG